MIKYIEYDYKICICTNIYNTIKLFDVDDADTDFLVYYPCAVQDNFCNLSEVIRDQHKCCSKFCKPKFTPVCISLCKKKKKTSTTNGSPLQVFNLQLSTEFLNITLCVPISFFRCSIECRSEEAVL